MTSSTRDAEDTGASDAPDGGEARERSEGSEERATATFDVPEMDCPSCAGKVTGALDGTEGVADVDPRVASGTVAVSYDAAETDVSDIEARVEGAGYSVEDVDVSSTTLSVPGMDCASCAGKVENALGRVEGIRQFQTSPTTGTVRIDYGPETSREELVAAVESAGYEVANADESGGESDDDADEADAESGSVWTSVRGVKTWISGGFLALGLVFEFFLAGANAQVASVLGSELLVADVLFLLGVAIGGQVILRDGYYSARNRNLDIDFLMSAAIVGALLASVAFGESLYFEAATLAFLFNVAELLESYAMDRARNSLTELMDLSPDEATVKRADGEETVPVEEVDRGDVVVVRPGEKIPMDGEVVEGSSAVNQAPITGESVPVDKAVGDEVFAGTINEGGYLEVEVTSTAGEDTLSRIVSMVAEAESKKTEREQFVERFSSYYTPVVVAFAVLTTLGTPFVLGVTWPTAVVYGLTLLVLACPCAFVISTPVSVVSGITSAAKNGVLIKGGKHLEAMGAVDAVAFDKTGTLTTGELRVTDVVPLNGNSEDDVLRCARGLEARSEHPVGEAIVTAAGEAGVDAEDTAEIEEFEALTGKGVRATLGGTAHVAGKPGLFEDLGFDLSHVHATTDGGVVTRTAKQLCERNNCLDLLETTVPELQAEGKTVILVGKPGEGDEPAELEGVVAVADEVRPEAERAIARLRELGVSKTVMLTGDNERTARAIADRVGVDEYRAELLPEEKVEEIEALVAEHERDGAPGGVAMVGDGINDAPALATATVGVAMGAAGTDTALETADVALMADDLSKLPYLYELAADANGVIRQNIWASLGIKALLAVGVPFGLVPIWLAVLAGDAGMTLGVTGNAMRLSRVTPESLTAPGE